MSGIFRPLLPEGEGKTYVQIGGVKWATMNIGANSVTDYGLYFQWGDTTGYTASQVGTSDYQKPFNWTDCVLHNGTSSYDNTTFTKYNGDDGLTELEPVNDAAVANWGGNWRMPTINEFAALIDATNAQWTSNYNGFSVPGVVMTDKTDSTKVLFFPAAGYCSGDFSSAGSLGTYWSSSLYNNVQYAHVLNIFQSSGTDVYSSISRYSGFSIRPVLDE